MTDTAVKGVRDIYDGVSTYNRIQFMIRNAINDVSTALPVKVVGVEAGGSGSSTGYVDVLPLVTMVDGNNNAVQPVTLYHLPYCRIQGGAVAIVTDPVPGDIGLAVFAHKDSSGVEAGTSEPVQPSSFRSHSQSDGFYIGGFLNQAPSCFLELKQDNTAVLTATGGVTINGDVTINGEVTATGDVHGNGHSLSNHTHTGVHGETSSANG